MPKPRHLLFFLLLLLPAITWGIIGDEEEPLFPDEAFVLQTSVSPDGAHLVAEWRIAPEYYLYRDKFAFTTDAPGITLGEPRIPEGKLKQDEFFGEVAVFYDAVRIEVPVLRGAGEATEITLSARSQGCWDKGLCYPPQLQTAALTLPASAGGTAPVSLAGTAAEPEEGLATRALQTLRGLTQDLGAGGDEFLDPEEAFKLEVVAIDTQTLRARWEIADGYYLYRDKLSFALEDARGARLGEPALPPSKTKNDEFFGEVETYPDDFELALPLSGADPAAGPLRLIVGYQGCADAGICYPPLTRELEVPLSGAAAVVTAAGFGTVASDAGPAGGPPLAEQDRILQQLLAADLWTVILLSIGFGLLVAFTACMYPMIPILSSIIVGQGENTTVARSFGLSLIYVQAMALTFGVVGAIMAMLGETVGIQAYFQSPWLLIPFALLFVLLALAMFGFYDIQVPSFIQSRLTAFSSKQRGGTLLGVGAMGVLSALIIGPCGGPVLVAELAYATATADPVKGFIALFAFGNGMGLPLLVVGATGGKLLPKAGVWMDAVKATAGVILLAVAIVMLERLPSIIPPSVTMLMWAALFIVTAIYLGVLEPITQGASGWRKLWKGLGAVFLIYGSIVLVGGITGGVSVTDPLHGSALTAAPTASGGGAASTQNSFRTVKTVEDLERELAAASASGQTVLLDFYADWCTYCKVLERYVFPDPGVQAALADTLLLKADVTRMDAEDTRLMSSLNVKLPPTLVLYDGNGEELRNYRIVGELKVDEFERHVRAAFGS